MAHPELDELITRLFAAGESEERIRESALKDGWSIEDVNGALALEHLRNNPLIPLRDTAIPARAVSTTGSSISTVIVSILVLSGIGAAAFAAYTQTGGQAFVSGLLGTASSTLSTITNPDTWVSERAPYNPYTFATSTPRAQSPSPSSPGGSIASAPAPAPVQESPAPVQTAPKPAAPRVTLSATADGTAYRLTWSSSNATSCDATGFSADGAVGGTVTVRPTASRNYSITCTGPGGSDKDTVAVTVAATEPPVTVPEPDPPTLTFTTNKTTIASGGSITLTWNTSHATSCSASGDWSGTRSTSGTQAQSGITSAKTYTLTCTGAGGSVSRTVAVVLEVVTTPAPTLTLSTDKTSVASGGSAVLTWNAGNATSCTATGDWSGARSTSGTQSQTNITAAKSYGLTCTGAGGSVARTVTVAVDAVVPPPATDTTVYSTAQLQTAIAAAKGGETILLGAGTYTTLFLSRTKPASMVTIQSANSNDRVRISGMEIDDAANLTFKNIDVDLGTRTMMQVTLTNSNNVHFDRVTFYDSANKNRGAVLLRWGSNLSIKNSEFYNMSGGVRVVTTSNITLSGNDIHDVSGDGIQSSGTSNITIKNNTLTDIFSGPGDHPDAIQFFTLNQTESARNIVITGNTYTRGNGNITQGIFMGNESGSRYQDVTISGNRIIGGMYNGIAIGEVDRATITNNIVQGYTDMNSWIIIGGSTDSTVSNNRATSYVYENRENTNFTFSNNETIQAASVGDTSILSVQEDSSSQLAAVLSLSWIEELWSRVWTWFVDVIT